MKCPICNQQDQILSWRAIANADGFLDKSFSVYACPHCGFGSTQPVPDSNQLTQYYATGFYAKSKSKAYGLIDYVLNAFTRQRLSQIEISISKKGKLLDVGCGKGRFLACASRSGWQAEGSEYSAAQAESAAQRYGAKVTTGEITDIHYPEANFDVVTAWHVLEHLVDLDRFVHEVHRIIKPEGVFSFEVPNFDSWQSRIAKALWFHADIPRHLNHFTPKSAEIFLQTAGFNVLSLRTLSFEMGPFGMLQSLMNLTGLPPNYFFQWLKRSSKNSSFLRTLLSVLTVILLALPSALIELFASLLQKGGVIRIIATKSNRS